MAFVGMMVGAIFAGRMSDILGRRRTILGCAVVFSVFTILCAFAPNAAVFAGLRFLAGVGLGGLVPSANALVAELVPTTLAGYHRHPDDVRRPDRRVHRRPRRHPT